MRPLLAAALLAVPLPASAQAVGAPTPDGIGGGDGRTAGGPAVGGRAARGQPPRSPITGRRSATTAYGYRLTAPDEDEDPTDRRVLRRLDTRLNNRLETRIERYRFVDTRSDRTGMTTRNPYAPRSDASGSASDPCLTGSGATVAATGTTGYSAVRTSSSSGKTRCSTTLAR